PNRRTTASARPTNSCRLQGCDNSISAMPGAAAPPPPPPPPLGTVLDKTLPDVEELAAAAPRDWKLSPAPIIGDGVGAATAGPDEHEVFFGRSTPRTPASSIKEDCN
ncbi:hypothetical protein Vretimale_18296, partial [Volvox reticuliferus]